MKEKEKDTLWPMLGIFLRGTLVILGLMLGMTALISLFSGRTFSADAIWKDFKMIFILSLIVLLILFLVIMIMTVFRVQTTPATGSSVILKDNTLRYETRDENGKKKRVTFSIRTIDRYLDRYGKMRIIDGMELEKRNSGSKSNLNNLLVNRDGKKISLNELNETDPKEYLRVCRFLESISSYDQDKLYWHLNTAIAKEEVILKGDELFDQLREAGKGIRDEQITDSIVLIQRDIEGLKARIEADGSSDKIRKLYDHYLPMLLGILKEYGRLEESDGDRKDLADSKNKLMLTFGYVDQAIVSLSETDSKEDFEKLEAAVNDVAMVLKTQERAEK